tara:strand:+ start:727 stop:1080 length:354 start_codon:yes stop_codon:yes gene_type:complete
MSIIRIISKKILRPEFSRVSFIEYTNELSENAKSQEGFIKSNSYWKTSLESSNKIIFEKAERLTIISISEWNELSDWDKWFRSELRNNIHLKYKKIIEDEQFSLLKKKVVNEDVFLL